MFDKAKSKVRWGLKTGETFENVQGVLQGGVISPALFNLFLEDLPNYMDSSTGVSISDTKVPYLLQADDLVLLSTSSAGLQRLINGLAMFCNHWQLTVNINKTKVLIFNNQHQIVPLSTKFVLNMKEIPVTNSYKYLGVIYSTGAQRFKEHISNLCDKAKKAIYGSRCIVRKALGKHLSPKVQYKIFDTQVRPILEYAIPTWFTGKAIPELETLHLQYLKHTLGVKCQTSSLAVYGETGRFPLLPRQQQLILKYWIRLANSDKHSVLYKTYSELLIAYENGHNNFITTVRQALNDAGYENLELCNIKTQISTNPRAFF